jgi:hypothetical protein
MTERRDDPDHALHTLLSRLLDGSISDQEYSELQFRLRDNPAAQQLYFDYLDLDTDLRQMSYGRSAVNNKPIVPSRLNKNTITLFALGSLAIAASVMFIATFPAWIRHDTLAVSKAKDVVLVQSAGGRFFRDTMPAVGLPLESHHEYALIAGVIELKFTGGAQVILEAPAVLEIASAERLIVKRGSCSVYAPPGAEGFQVLTPQSEVTDLGTRFAVSVSEVGDTEVHVVEGTAEVRGLDPKSLDKVLLKERQASRFDGDDSSAIEFTSSQFRSHLPDRVISFRIGSVGGVSNGQLESVSVQRAGRPHEYTVQQLIGVEVTHFRGGSNTHHLSAALGEDIAEGFNRKGTIDSDSLLHTGMLNPGGSRQVLTHDPVLKGNAETDTTPGMAIRFRKPVVNGPGPDVVFFELQSVANPADGDGFHVSPLQFEPGLRSVTVMRYDITLNSAEALRLPKFDLLRFESRVTSIDDLLTGSFKQSRPSLDFYAIATSIDLSDLGYPMDVAVEGLFFQDAADDEEHQVDPVFIGGLPPLKEKAE